MTVPNPPASSATLGGSTPSLVTWAQDVATAINTGQPGTFTGATAATRFVGGTTSGAPTTGTFAVGDYVIDQSGAHWICTVAGTPGTWVQAGNATFALLDGSSQAYATTARDRRANAPAWNSVTGALSSLTSSGLSLASGVISATVGGTDGNAILPLWSGDVKRRSLRASARITATKATASSKSYVGYCTTAQSTLPSPTDFTFGVGYLQGTGLVYLHENVGAPVVMLADASITDGHQYDVSIQVDVGLNTAGGQTNGTIYCLAKDVATGAEIALTGAGMSLSFFAPTNLLIRTNVAAGAITQAHLSGHPLGTIGLNTSIDGIQYDSGGDAVFLVIPANPNGKMVIACHGRGDSTTSMGWSSTAYRPVWLALAADGFTVAIPGMGGDLWGNPTAQALMAKLYAELIAQYDLDPQVYLYGNSEGGGACLTAIALNTFGSANRVRAAYITEPACDLAGLSATFPDIATAYPHGTAGSDPLKQPASAYANVPICFTASTGDTLVPETTNTDAMRTLIGSQAPTFLIPATGNHNDPSEYRPLDTVAFFQANL